MAAPFGALTQQMIDGMADAVLITDEPGAILFANELAESVFGAPAAALRGLSVDALVPARAVGAGVGADMARVSARRLDGSPLSVAVSTTALREGDRNWWLICVRDVTWREELEEAVRESERRHRHVVESASEVFYRVALDGDPFRGRVEFVSPQCESLTGYPPDVFLADSSRWVELIHEDDLPALARSTQAILSERKPGTRIYRMRNLDGTYRHIEDRVVPITHESGGLAGYQGVARDVTERVQAEVEKAHLDERLRRSEKMELLGRMAGGVAHDFNNLLTVILGISEGLLRDTDLDGPVGRDLQEVVRAGRRAANLTRQLLAMSRKQIISPRPVDLNAHLEGLKDMLRRTVTSEIGLSFSLARDPWSVFVDPSQVDQVVLNLVANSRDSMPNGGELAVGTANVTLDDAFRAAHPGATQGDFVRVSVRDQGVGMEEETLRNAFEPFFTTKPEGEGTGIGLASVYGIVKQNGGFVHIESAVGCGTTVDVYLPRHSSEPGLAHGEPQSDDRLHGGHETVLLVEDDDEVRAVLVRLLEQLGYRVLQADGPFAALGICENGVPIDVLVSDVLMPGMKGSELAGVVRTLRPTVGILLISGHAENLIQDRLPEGTVFLSKPLSLAGLSSAVRTALDRRGG